MSTIRIGTRSSELAIWQANYIKAKIIATFPEQHCELVYIKTQGDRLLDQHLALIGGKALFIKELEQALLDHKIDLAVHSMKDVPSEIHPSFSIPIITKREDPSDAFVSIQYQSFDELPKNAVIGSSSLRRCAQLLHLRPDLQCKLLRGNVNTRLKKLQDGDFDAIVLASAGLIRLGKTEMITARFPISSMLPAVSQGVLGIEIRKNDQKIYHFVQHVHHQKTANEVACERAFLSKLAANCQVPVAAFAQCKNDTIDLQGMILSLDGKQKLTESISTPIHKSQKAAQDLADKLLDLGGKAILESINGIKA